MNDDVERLISRYLDGTATSDEVARLDGLLRQDPEVRRALFLASEQGDALRELFGEGRNAALARQAELAPVRRTWFVAAAAVLAIAFVGSVILGLSKEAPRPVEETALVLPSAPPAPSSPVPVPSPVPPRPPVRAPDPQPAPAPAPEPPSPAAPAPVKPAPAPSPAPAPAAPPVPRDTVVTVGIVEKVGGDVRILSGDRILPASAGLKLLSGQGVETLGRGRAVLALDKGVTLEIGADTLISGVVGSDVALEKGSVQGDLTPARSRESVVVATGRARAEIGGTKFSIRSGPDGTWLGVDRGRGRLQRKEDGAAIEISAGQFGVVIPGMPFAPRAQDVAVDQVRIDEAIAKGVEFLRTAKDAGQNAKKSSEELLLWTLLHAGITESDPLFKRLLTEMLESPLEKTYNVSLQAMILEELDRAKYQYRLQQCGQYLVDNQCKNGQWSYGTPSQFVDSLPVPSEAPRPVQTGGARDFSAAKEKPKVTRKLPVKKMREGPASGDNSNSQYAALGLRACFDGGIELPRAVVQAAKDWWIKSQGPDEAPNSGYEGVRGWAYQKTDGKDDDDLHTALLGSMTAGAVGGLVICDYILGIDWKKNVQARAGLNWLASHFTVSDNPGGKPWRHYYYLYGLERAGILYGTDKLGAHAWYPLGARYLIENQQPNGSWKLQNQNRTNPLWDTCFAILFLKKATKPLVASEDRKGRK
jgi:ferric-dicitrate binding protein FerR (iron transport regulator)